MAQPLVSILVPFKNTAEFLSECLYSILAQSFTNWELLIVDDHSTDGSYDLVFAFAEKDSRIKLFENEGLGIIPALRKAYQKSSGHFITRMDSDDLMHPDKLLIMLKDLQTFGNRHIALGMVSYFSKNGVGNGYKAYEEWLNDLIKTGSNYSKMYKECVIPSPCWMLHREDFERCGAFCPETYPEDYDLAFRLYKQNIKCIPSQNVLHYWRDHKNRASRTNDHYAENNFLELKINYFISIDYKYDRQLAIWGAGQKGKKIARHLQSKYIDFLWLCDNPKKIGKHIYEVLMEDYRILSKLEIPQIIVAVANPKEQKNIVRYLEGLDLVAGADYYFFC